MEGYPAGMITIRTKLTQGCQSVSRDTMTEIGDVMPSWSCYINSSLISIMQASTQQQNSFFWIICYLWFYFLYLFLFKSKISYQGQLLVLQQEYRCAIRKLELLGLPLLRAIQRIQQSKYYVMVFKHLKLKFIFDFKITECYLRMVDTINQFQRSIWKI